ncbi:U6 snRNA phosphodiesterase isoform X2 [Spodoptera litura]|uniref:U6 snRNA phosphodiesterase n=1 Tax=Spodoptera litura TaxID=69820 RepID=A0A9J7EV33_SPOLT|nr:U6 snRNA phosphodiesterase isoform X2 [Spodoptera litura]
MLYRPKLPAPDLSKVAVVPSDTHFDDPLLHGGRLRSFPHVRGNWATFVYVNYHHQTEVVFNLLRKIEKVILTKVDTFHRCDDLHISLSKTFVLKYHLISTFSSSLQKVLSTVESFDIGFGAVKVYCNEDQSRTFISLDVDPFSHKNLLNVSKKVDDVMIEFQLPTFYEDPSFHMSLLWTNGNKKSEFDTIIDTLNDLLLQEIEKDLSTVLIDTINCKSGNKYFQYSLV